MNGNEYFENPSYTDSNKLKSFLTFNEVDQEFLAANNFVVLNLDNIEEYIPPAPTAITATFNSYTSTEAPHQFENDLDKTSKKEPNLTETSTKTNQNHRRKLKKIPNQENESAASPTKTFPCDLCDDTFTSLKDLKKHKDIQHILFPPYKCQECHKGFNFETNFMLHIKSHTTRIPAECPVCRIIFQRASSFKGHLESHMFSDHFKCNRCDMEFEFEEYYERHNQTVHHKHMGNKVSKIPFKVRKRNDDAAAFKTAGKYSCNACGKRFPKPCLLHRHKITHTKIKLYECTECHQRFSQKSSLDRHNLHVHQGIKQFDCPHCKLSFAQRTNLIAHMQRVHPESPDIENKHPCPKCSCIFNKLNSLNRHITLTHSKPEMISGSFNDDDLFINEVLAQIKSLQNDYPSEPPQRDPSVGLISGYEAAAEESSSKWCTTDLSSHLLGSFRQNDNNSTTSPNFNEINFNHIDSDTGKCMENFIKEICIDGNKWFECKSCSKQFLKSFEILRHVQSVHKMEKPYECEMCGKNFALKNNLKVHQRIHERLPDAITKVYQCSVCMKRVNSLRKLDQHARLHKNYKPYACSVCFKPFGTSNNLRIHELNHKPKNPVEEEIKRRLLTQIGKEANEVQLETDCTPRNYQCSICGLKYKRSSHLQQHEISHLGLKPFQCNICHKYFATKSSLGLHEKIHSDHRNNECEQCHAKFSRISSLRYHLLSVHSTARNFTCPYCEKTFKTENVLKKHIMTHVKDVILEEATQELEEDYENFDEQLEAPLADTENELVNCNYMLILNDKLPTGNSNSGKQPSLEELHSYSQNLLNQELVNDIDMSQVSATSENQENNDATEASWKFINIKDLSNSKNQLSENIIVISHENPTSTGKITTISNMVINKNSQPQSKEILFRDARAEISNPVGNISRKKPPHNCEICRKSFKKPVDLRRHLRTHTKEKPFKCDLCSKAFSLKGTLDDHKLIHQKDRPTFACQVCGKRYATKGVLQVHLRLHTGEKPYECEICFKTFRTSGHKLAHARIHLKEKAELAKKRKR